MNDFVISLDQIRPKDAKRVGGKAAALSRLIRAGFPVPPGICLTTSAFWFALDNKRQQIDSIVSQYDLHDRVKAQTASDQIIEILGHLEVPASILTIAAEMIDEKASIAVRSSATAEDQVYASYAGQYTTILGVRGVEAIQTAIIDCWRSFYAPQALVARATHNSLGKEEAMALIIQPMVDAACAGVCFSVDPVRRQRDMAVVNAAWGLGLGVVDGEIASDTTWIRRPGFEIDRSDIREKTSQVALDPEGGIQIADVLGERRKAACLPEAWARRIAQFAAAAEALFGKPQDVEWAIADQKVWILQSRPITALSPEMTQTPRFPVKQKIQHFWSLMDEYGIDKGPLLPLEQDAILVAESIREEACRFMGADRNQETQYFNGRAYIRPLSMNFSAGDRRIRRQAINDLNDRLHEQGLTAWDYWGPEIVRTTERLRAFDDSADGKALLNHLEDALAARRRHAMLHPICSFDPHPAYFQALEKITGKSDNMTLAYRLLEGEENPLMQLVDKLYDLAQSAAPVIQALIRDSPVDAFDQLKVMPEAEKFLGRLEDILLIYGERTGDGWGSEVTILNPTWREQPQAIFHLLVFYFDSQVESPAAIRARNQSERETLLETLYQECNDQAVIETFRRELNHARRVAAVLEIHNHYIDQMATGQLRQAVMMSARWLAQQDILKQVDDIFWLYFDEILAALRSPVSYADEIANRKAQHEKWRNLQAPPFLGIPNITLPARPPWRDDTTPADNTRDGFIIGQGASPGKTQGRARLMTDHIDQLAPGDILVAKNVGPRWTPVFPLLGGLVLDDGAIGQHAAAIAREYKIPAVIGTRFATRRIPEGAQIIVDGTNGTIEFLVE